MARRVALVRGVNVAGRGLPMAELRALAEGLGWRDVATYIQSGNLLFDARGNAAALEAKLEDAILGRFAMKVSVMIRTAAELQAYLDGNPFERAAREAPKALLLLVPKRPPPADAEDKLRARAEKGERVGRAGDGLWVWYPNGIARSKLSPLLIDRLVDSPATSRNWRTVMKLTDLLAAGDRRTAGEA